MAELHTLLTGLALGESPRWHDNRLWFADWGAQEVVAVDLAGQREVILRGLTLPFCIDWLPDGRLLIVAGREGRLLRQEPDGSLVTIDQQQVLRRWDVEAGKLLLKTPLAEKGSVRSSLAAPARRLYRARR